MKDNTVIRFGVYPYLNTLPLIAELPVVCPQCELSMHMPAQTVSELLSGHVCAALVPIADLLDQPTLTKLGAIGICVNGPVMSVLLHSQKPWSQVRTVCLDPASRSSNELVRILNHLREPRVDMQWIPDTTPADAELIIGDRALQVQPGPFTYDLGEVWKNRTGLPFVFAAWACQRDDPLQDALRDMICEAHHRGQRALDRLIHEAAVRWQLPESTCHRYLAKALYYTIGTREREAISLFHHLRVSLPSNTLSDCTRIVSNHQSGETYDRLPYPLLRG
jgi:chorismate dehydratase